MSNNLNNSKYRGNMNNSFTSIYNNDESRHKKKNRKNTQILDDLKIDESEIMKNSSKNENDKKNINPNIKNEYDNLCDGYS